MSNESKVRIRTEHQSSITGLLWCFPVKWEPSNVINGELAESGTWWDVDDQSYGLAVLDNGSIENGMEAEVPSSQLRILSCGNCEVVASVVTK
jgi:hypothetical protein